MNNKEVIIDINRREDISKITSKTKYIAISIDNFDDETINYFFDNGYNYSYTDIVNNKSSYIYASYDIFREGEGIIDDIISGIDKSFSTLEKARYIYITLGKRISTDINVSDEKNNIVSFENFALINNIWGAIVKWKATDFSLAKLFMYICRKVGIKCDTVCGNVGGKYVNRVYIDNLFIIVDLFNDLCNIQGNFITSYFGKYNDDKKLDRKIGYIKDEYNNYYIDKILNKIDYTKEDVVYKVLSLTEKIIPISKIGAFELGNIYTKIFKKYCPNYDIKINNLYMCNNIRNKEHFIVISYNDKIYGFNYSKREFTELNKINLLDSLRSAQIGIYENEDFNISEREVII